MPRWEPDSRGRLQQAAMELYAERGYDQTTVAEIAARAGVTERTFFRHFADKREVLFDRQHLLADAFVGAVAVAPDSATPLEAATAGLEAAACLLEQARGREFARRRQRLIDANPELQERELIKLASLAEAVADTLRARGVAEPTATLTGEVAVAVFRTAFGCWLDKANRRDFPQVTRETLETLKAVSAAAPRQASAGVRARRANG
jgi:AcrR family transcriptional regulator